MGKQPVGIESLLNVLSERVVELKKIGKYFNMLSVMGILRAEAEHSRFIANLLDPRGSHGQDALFLSLFCSQLGQKFKIENMCDNLENALVITESHLGKKTQKKGGRLDIRIDRLGGRRPIFIENKIDAGDQDRQLFRYNNTKGNPIVFYLTPSGHDASEDSRVNLKQNQDYYCISYYSDIYEWLVKCADAIKDKLYLRALIENYKDSVKELATGGTMENNIADILKKEENIESSGLIIDEIISIGKILKRDISTELEKLCSDAGLELKNKSEFKNGDDTMFKNGDDTMDFYKPGWKNYRISFVFGRGFPKSFSWGIFNKSGSGNNKIRKVFEEKIGKQSDTDKVETVEYWPFWHYLNRFDTVGKLWTDWYSGKIQHRILEDVKKYIAAIDTIVS